MAPRDTKSSSASASRLGASVVVRGTIRGSGDLEIAGNVEGIVQIDGALDVEETAKIRSSVSGARVTVRGAILGDVTGSESVVLEAGARVVGDLSAPSIGIRPGGLLRGHVASGDLAGATASRSVAARTPAPRAVRQPAVAAPTRREEAPRAVKAEPKVVEPKVEAPAPAPQAASPQAGPRTKPAASLRGRTQTVRSNSEPVDDDPLADLLRQAPPPIMPSLQRGAKAQLKKKSR